MNSKKISNIRKEALIEYKWRRDDIYFFEEQIKKFPRTNNGLADRERYRKSLVMVLYSHFEGYCKFMFQLYINSVNLEKIKCKDAAYPIVAATLDNEFKSLINPKKSSNVFPKVLSIEDSLHPFARRADFLEEIDNFMNKIVNIPDKLIDLESNLKPIVMRKNLYKLGLPYQLFDSVESEISQLLAARNGIAHGASTQGIPLNRYNNLRLACFYTMNTLRQNIILSLKNREYQKI